MVPNLFEKRFLIVAGKGGVGKSAVCAALGLAAAKRGLKTCIAELNTREKAPLFFGRPAAGYTYQELRPNLFSINIQPEPALREYGLMKLRFETIYNMVFENEAMRRIINVIPGMNELFLLGKAFNMEREKVKGRPAWDLIIVDAPATGHGVSLLRLPDTILKVADKAGPMTEELQLMRALLLDPKKTAINLVTLPEEMPVRETFELAGQVRDILSIPRGYLIANAIWPKHVQETDAQLVAALEAVLPPEETRARAALSTLKDMSERRAFQEQHLRDLRDNLPEWPMVAMPYLFSETFGLPEIERLSETLTLQFDALQGRPA